MGDRFAPGQFVAPYLIAELYPDKYPGFAEGKQVAIDGSSVKRRPGKSLSEFCMARGCF